MSLKYVNYDINNIYFLYFQYQQAVITLVFCITFIFQTRSNTYANQSCSTTAFLMLISIKYG